MAIRTADAPYRLRHDRNGDELQAMEDAIANWSRQRPGTERKDQQRRRRRQGESCPGSKTAHIARPHESKRKTNLAARRAWQELAQSDEIGEGMLVNPLASDDEFVPKIADVSDRSTEAGQPKPGEDAEHFHRRARAGLRLRWFCASRHNYPCLNPPLILQNIGDACVESLSQNARGVIMDRKERVIPRAIDLALADSRRCEG